MSTRAFIHPDANCESSSIGDGTRIWGTSHVMKGAKIGARCNLGELVFVEDEVTIGDDCVVKNGVALWNGITIEDGVFLGPFSVFTNDLRPRAFLKRDPKTFLSPTLIKRGATIGANATIVCGVTIGEFSMIGSGAVVTQDVPAHALFLGVPAQMKGYVCYCGARVSSESELKGGCAHGHASALKTVPWF